MELGEDDDFFGGDESAGNDGMGNAELRALERNSYQIGFQEGVEIGREAALQRGFDEGYERGFAETYSATRQSNLISILKSHAAFSKTSRAEFLDLAEKLSVPAHSPPPAQANTSTNLGGQVVHTKDDRSNTTSSVKAPLDTRSESLCCEDSGESGLCCHDRAKSSGRDVAAEISGLTTSSSTRACCRDDPISEVRSSSCCGGSGEVSACCQGELHEE